LDGYIHEDAEWKMAGDLERIHHSKDVARSEYTAKRSLPGDGPGFFGLFSNSVQNVYQCAPLLAVSTQVSGLW
jgi:hypothetical protein